MLIRPKQPEKSSSRPAWEDAASLAVQESKKLAKRGGPSEVFWAFGCQGGLGFRVQGSGFRVVCFQRCRRGSGFRH